MTSIMLGALGGCIITRKFLSNTKSYMLIKVASALLPTKEITSRMLEMEEGMLGIVF